MVVTLTIVSTTSCADNTNGTNRAEVNNAKGGYSLWWPGGRLEDGHDVVTAMLLVWGGVKKIKKILEEEKGFLLQKYKKIHFSTQRMVTCYITVTNDIFGVRLVCCCHVGEDGWEGVAKDNCRTLLTVLPIVHVINFCVLKVHHQYTLKNIKLKEACIF